MARLRTNVLHWGGKEEGPNTYKMGREGALDDAYWDEDELVDYPHRAKKKKKRKRSKTRPGCIGNDYGPHIYVWTTEFENTRDVFYSYYGYFKYESRICCGCRKKNGRQKTEKYEKKKHREWVKRYGDLEELRLHRGKGPVQRYRGSRYTWWAWETEDEGFNEHRRLWQEKYGPFWTNTGTNYWGW